MNKDLKILLGALQDNCIRATESLENIKNALEVLKERIEPYGGEEDERTLDGVIGVGDPIGKVRED